MRAAIFNGPGVPLSIERVADPEPAPGEVVVRVGRCGICGTDLSMTAPGPIQYERGAGLGHEYSGTVVALGRGVDGMMAGDRIVAMPVAGCGACSACAAGDPFGCAAMRPMMGGFGEFTVARADHCLKLPDGLTFSDGAIIEPLAVGRRCVRLANMVPGANALVLGAGPIALATAFWARRAGALVTLAARSGRHADLACHMGANHFELSGQIDSMSPGWDYIFECTGARGMMGRAIALVRSRGTIMLGGLCMESEAFVPASIVFKELRIQATLGYALADFEESLRALEAGAVEPRAMVTDTIPLDDLPARFEAMRTDRSGCKIIVDPWATDHGERDE